MTKITVAILAIAAFIYALFLVLARRPLPETRKTCGGRRRFLLAALLFVGLLGEASAMGRKPRVLCYDMAISQPPLSTREGLVAALQAIWRTLDPASSKAFRDTVEAAAGKGAIRKKTADMLAVAYSELAYHKQRTRGKGPRVTCYRMTPFGNTLYKTRENALKQVELLQQARESGKIDEQTALKAHEVLAREVQMLHRAKAVQGGSDWQVQKHLVEEYAAGQILAGDVASVTAQTIVALEGAQLPDLSCAQRLSTMKHRVDKLLTEGPFANDWEDPDIRPNVLTVLEKAGLVKRRSMVTCYDRIAVPVKARSEELKKLQQQLLDKNIRAGILDVEVADRAAEAAVDEQDIDYATEQDIRDYQKKVRRAMRLLYKHGELPSSFVEDMADALDVEIIAFDSTRALRNDARWYLRSLFWQPVGHEVLKMLEKRGLIGPKSNHRLIFHSFGHTRGLSDEQKEQLADFEAMIDGDGRFDLPDDEKVSIWKRQIPQTDTEYRLRLRTICRALCKTGLVQPKRLERIEQFIGIPVTGTIEGR